MSKPILHTMEKELTKVELQLMNILWDMGEAFVNDILEKLPEPKPAYNTVSTFMRILVSKGFVGFVPVGKGHQYHPLVSRETYMDFYLTGVKNNFFKGSFSGMMSYFARKEKISPKEMEKLLSMIEQNRQEP